MSQVALDYIITGRNEFFASKVNSTLFSKAEYQENPSYTFCISGIHVPFGNAVWQHPFSSTNKYEINTILNAFKQKQLPFFWWEAPISAMSENNEIQELPNLKDILLEEGLQIGGLLKGIYASLNEAHPIIYYPNITIRPVQTFDDLRLFCQLIFSIHGAEPAVIEELYTLAEKSIQKTEEINYLAYQPEFWVFMQPLITDDLVLLC